MVDEGCKAEVVAVGFDRDWEVEVCFHMKVVRCHKAAGWRLTFDEVVDWHFVAPVAHAAKKVGRPRALFTR